MSARRDCEGIIYFRAGLGELLRSTEDGCAALFVHAVDIRTAIQAAASDILAKQGKKACSSRQTSEQYDLIVLAGNMQSGVERVWIVHVDKIRIEFL